MTIIFSILLISPSPPSNNFFFSLCSPSLSYAIITFNSDQMKSKSGRKENGTWHREGNVKVTCFTVNSWGGGSVCVWRFTSGAHNTIPPLQLWRGEGEKWIARFFVQVLWHYGGHWELFCVEGEQILSESIKTHSDKTAIWEEKKEKAARSFQRKKYWQTVLWMILWRKKKVGLVESLKFLGPTP